MFKNSVFFRGEKVAIHPNSLKNLRGGRKKGSKNKTTLAKKDIEKLLETQEDIKEKAEKINLSKDDLVEVLVASKESTVLKNKVEGKEIIYKMLIIHPELRHGKSFFLDN